MSQWNSSLCCPDNGNCVYAFFCAPCAAASARSAFDSSNCCFNCLCVSGPVAYNIIREGYGIEGDCCSDILTGTCCYCCAAARLTAEVYRRGPASKPMR